MRKVFEPGILTGVQGLRRVQAPARGGLWGRNRVWACATFANRARNPAGTRDSGAGDLIDSRPRPFRRGRPRTMVRGRARSAPARVAPCNARRRESRQAGRADARLPNGCRPRSPPASGTAAICPTLSRLVPPNPASTKTFAPRPAARAPECRPGRATSRDRGESSSLAVCRTLGWISLGIAR